MSWEASNMLVNNKDSIDYEFGNNCLRLRLFTTVGKDNYKTVIKEVGDKTYLDSMDDAPKTLAELEEKISLNICKQIEETLQSPNSCNLNNELVDFLMKVSTGENKNKIRLDNSKLILDQFQAVPELESVNVIYKMKS